MAELRGWDRLITWRTYTTPRARWSAIRAFLKLPARAARNAYRDVARFGDAVTSRAGISRGRQVAQLWWLALRYGMDAKSYLDYQLYRPDRRPRAPRYLREKEFVRIVQFIKAHESGGDADILYDKRRFDAWCAEQDFLTTATLMEIEQGRITHSIVGEGTLPPCDLFAKPAQGAGGRGVRRWRYTGGEYVDDAGHAVQAAQVLDELLAASRGEAEPGRPQRILVQRCLKNHHALGPLTPGGLCTIRLQTYRWPGGESQLLLGVYKMPVGNTPADNFHFGGIVAPVDLATGRLRQAVRRDGPLVVDIERHPDTGAPIAGHAIPFWDDAVRLVLRAHDGVPRLATVGWDVAILEEGPALVEGNTVPNPLLAQLPSGTPLGDTPLAPCLNAYLRDCFVSACTPSTVPHRAAGG